MAATADLHVLAATALNRACQPKGKGSPAPIQSREKETACRGSPWRVQQGWSYPSVQGLIGEQEVLCAGGRYAWDGHNLRFPT